MVAKNSKPMSVDWQESYCPIVSLLLAYKLFVYKLCTFFNRRTSALKQITQSRYTLKNDFNTQSTH